MSELYGICLNFQKIGGVLTVIAWYAVCYFPFIFFASILYLYSSYVIGKFSVIYGCD